MKLQVAPLHVGGIRGVGRSRFAGLVAGFPSADEFDSGEWEDVPEFGGVDEVGSDQVVLCTVHCRPGSDAEDAISNGAGGDRFGFMVGRPAAKGRGVGWIHRSVLSGFRVLLACSSRAPFDGVCLRPECEHTQGLVSDMDSDLESRLST